MVDLENFCDGIVIAKGLAAVSPATAVKAKKLGAR
jgi:hypothetical protein